MMGFEKDENQEGFDEAPRSFLRRNRKTGKSRKSLRLVLIAAVVVVLLTSGIILLLSGGDERSQEVANKKTLEIGGAENLPEASSQQDAASEPEAGPGQEAAMRLDSTLADMETRMDENHEQVMRRLAELARRVVENNEHARKSLEMMEKLEARIDTLEKQYQQYRLIEDEQSGAAPETQRDTRTEADTDKQKPSESEDSEPEDRYYTVKKNDTLYSIAKDNGLSLGTLLEINGLEKDSVIQPGDRLKVNR